jgi:predicted O-methyltransferase YrrM
MMQYLPFLAVFNLALTIIAVAVALACYHKSKRAHEKLFENDSASEKRLNNLYSQIESLLAIYQDLKPHASLPNTRGWAASPDFLNRISKIVATQRPERIVECSSGASTVVLARAAQLNSKGHVFSLEHDPFYAEKTRAELRRHSLEDYATVLDSRLMEHLIDGSIYNWYDPTGLPEKIDLLVIDGPPGATQKMARYPAVPILNSRLNTGAIIILDDADRADERIAIERWKTRFNFDTIHETPCEKGISVLRK